MYARLHQFACQMFNTLLPPYCVLCTRPVRHIVRNICLDCEQDLPILPDSCAKCAQSLPGTVILSEAKDDKTARDNKATRNDKILLCGTCLIKPPPFDFTYAMFPYQTPITHLITGLKFQHKLAYAKALGELLISRINTDWYDGKPLPDVIIPMPLHPLRLRERGFNQALEIARPVSKKLGIAIDFLGTQRVRHTARQTGLLAKERRRNVAGAFSISANYKGQHIAVIDDVITTGKTMSAFCQMLKTQQPGRIDIWCCARR